jgi:hypothetical protein
MTQRNLIDNNRVFYDPGLNYAITSNLTTNVGLSNLVIDIDDTADLQERGYAYLGNISTSYEIIYYSSKTSNTLVLPTGGRGVNGTSIQAWNATTYPKVTQYHSAPNSLISSQGDTQLAGWYVTPNTKQASLRVYDSPVILPGVIRFKEDASGTGGVFQGCTDVSSNGVTWALLNAQKGDKGDPGIIDTELTFEYVGTVTNPSISGLIIKNTTPNVAISNIEVRPIISGNTVINQASTSTCNVTTTADNIIITPTQQPYSWDCTANTNVLKGSPGTDSLLNSYGTTHTYLVAPGQIIYKGQVVTIKSFTNMTAPNDTFMVVEPLTYTNITELNNYKLVPPYNNLCITGIARETVDASAVIEILTAGDRKPIRIAVDGLALVKMSNNVDPLIFIPNNTVNYSGRPCLLTRDAYGFNNQATPSALYNYIQIGWFTETGASVGTNGNYALVRLAPQFLTF